MRVTKKGPRMYILHGCTIFKTMLLKHKEKLSA